MMDVLRVRSIFSFESGVFWSDATLQSKLACRQYRRLTAFEDVDISLDIAHQDRRKTATAATGSGIQRQFCYAAAFL